MEPEKPLPFSDAFIDADDYVEALLQFVTESDMLQTLCGGIHILDFLTRDPDLYTQVLPLEWRNWLSDIPVMDFLDFLLRDNVDSLLRDLELRHQSKWRDRPLPPRSLLVYVQTARNLMLQRDFIPSESVIPGNLSHRMAVGMKPKKAHEVENFAAFVDGLIEDIRTTSGCTIDHVVDFGSGQNYLGRVLASPLYQRPVIAVESKHWNISSARSMDVSADMAKKIVIWRNKKAWRQTGVDNADEIRREREKNGAGLSALADSEPKRRTVRGAKMRYIEHNIINGDLSEVLGQFGDIRSQADEDSDPGSDTNPGDLMVVSLHSCGNLLHHGLRSLTMNPSVKAVAMVGCCYNLVTERLGPPTTKIPNLRIFNKRLAETSSACDPHGFPMSEKLASYAHRNGTGVRMNITARMMAVQAPQNWTESECNDFFNRHFFRSLLQRIMFDKGFIEAPLLNDNSRADSVNIVAPVVIGALRKSCYDSFLAYVRGALEKLMRDPEHSARLEACMGRLTDEEILGYERHYKPRRHHLCLIWTLMAFSACVVETLMVVDRWLYLKEQPEVEKCWVQCCFDYQQSPRNLAVVGIKR